MYALDWQLDATAVGGGAALRRRHRNQHLQWSTRDADSLTWQRILPSRSRAPFSPVMQAMRILQELPSAAEDRVATFGVMLGNMPVRIAMCRQQSSPVRASICLRAIAAFPSFIQIKLSKAQPQGICMPLSVR